MSFSDIYVFVISSLDHPIYRKIQKKRKALLKFYNIPYTVIINSDEVDVNNMKAESTLTPLEEDEVLYNGAGYNPYMSQKFLMGVKMLFRSYKNFNDVPNYIVRLNASVYVHFPSLLHTIRHPDFPRERVLAGPNWDDMFVQGMIMVFSKDVLLNILKDQRMYSKSIMRHNDDVALSVLADPYSKWIDWNQYLCTSSSYNSKWHYTNMSALTSCEIDKRNMYAIEKIRPRENKKWIFRLRDENMIGEFIWGPDSNDRIKDIENWDNLVQYFKEPIVEHYEIAAIKKKKNIIPYKLVIITIVATSIYYYYKYHAKEKKKR